MTKYSWFLLRGLRLWAIRQYRLYVGRIYEEAKGRPHYVVRKLTVAQQYKLAAVASA